MGTITPNATTKLSAPPKKAAKDGAAGIMNRKPADKHPATFRFSADDKQNLRVITKAVNQASRQKVSQTKVMQALIQLGTRTSTTKIIEALRELI